MSQPQPNSSDKSQRTLPRIQRRELHHIEEGDSHVWAVSYADLLMVLLAFFVIFFSLDSPSKKDKLRQLSLGLQSAGFSAGLKEKTSEKGRGLASLPSGTVDAKDGTPASRPEIKLLGRSLGIVSQQIRVDGDNLQLLLPDNVFQKGEYVLNNELRAQLDQIFATLQPFQRDLQIVVVGHSDSMGFAKRHNAYLGDNFDLSTLRALRALQYGLKKGFPHDQISAQGAADGVRSSRTISLKVSWKEAR